MTMEIDVYALNGFGWFCFNSNAMPPSKVTGTTLLKEDLPSAELNGTIACRLCAVVVKSKLSFLATLSQAILPNFVPFRLSSQESICLALITGIFLDVAAAMIASDPT